MKPIALLITLTLFATSCGKDSKVIYIDSELTCSGYHQNWKCQGDNMNCEKIGHNKLFCQAWKEVKEEDLK